MKNVMINESIKDNATIVTSDSEGHNVAFRILLGGGRGSAVAANAGVARAGDTVTG